jgi:hypothetical protein
MTASELHTLGNTDILQHHKVAFLCSRKCPAAVVLKSFDWAIEQRDKGTCVISGFHSRIEKDVLHYLLKGTQPVILALGMMKRWPPEINAALDDNRLMLELADAIFIGYASPEGNLERLCEEYAGKKMVMAEIDQVI